MPGSQLQWAIGKSKLPPNFKLTLWALSLVADADQGYANIYLSKFSIGQLTSRSARIAREDISDLVEHGVLRAINPSSGRRTSQYQIDVGAILQWSDADTKRLAQARALRRERYRRNGSPQRGSVQPRSGTADAPANADPYSRSTRIRTAAQRGSVQPPISRSEDRSEGTVAERGERPVHAAENSAAPGADVPGSVPRSSATFVEPQSRYDRHAHPAAKHRHDGPAEVTEASIMRPSAKGLTFELLAESGRRWMAGYQGAEADLSGELRSHLKGVAKNLGNRDGALLNRVLASLEAQHAHFVAHPRGNPSPEEENRSTGRYEFR